MTTKIKATITSVHGWEDPDLSTIKMIMSLFSLLCNHFHLRLQLRIVRILTIGAMPCAYVLRVRKGAVDIRTYLFELLPT